MSSHLPERPYTIKEAAALLGLPTWKLQRAVKDGLIPSYTFLNRRKLVRLSEIDAALKREGGLHRRRQQAARRMHPTAAAMPPSDGGSDE